MKLRLCLGVTPICRSASSGSQVSSQPVSTKTSIGGVARSSSFGFRATTLTQ